MAFIKGLINQILLLKYVKNLRNNSAEILHPKYYYQTFAPTFGAAANISAFALSAYFSKFFTN